MDRNRGIGVNGSLPWKIRTDMAFFKSITTTGLSGFEEIDKHSLSPLDGNGTGGETNAVLMGRKTWESIPDKYRPLPGRFNIILTSKRPLEPSESLRSAPSLHEALGILEAEQCNHLYIIGGGAVYREALGHPRCGRLYITEIMSSFDCDTYFPEIPSRYRETASTGMQEEGSLQFRFRILDSVSAD